MFLGSVHGQFSCQFCHGGLDDDEFKTMEEAHEGMVADPSADGVCDACHRQIATATANSLHTNLWGEKTAIETRGRCTFEGSGVEADFAMKCGGCHTTCGQCHISRPNSVGGGFPKIGSSSSHRFRKSPDMNEQCTACHGSRVGTDFKGEVEGNLPDVHRSAGATCDMCHTAREIHGDGQYQGDHYNSRYEVATMPRCEDCHSPLARNTYHDVHTGAAAEAESRRLQCQVCHSQPYKNCTNCHNLGTPGFDIEPSVIQFKIGRNSNPNRTDYDFSVVRHVPIDPGTYSDWGLDLPGYLDEPTWKYASPHNILRWTPQTVPGQGGSCSLTCHRTPDSPAGYFLRESDLFEADGVTRLPDYDANIGVVIEEDFTSSK